MSASSAAPDPVWLFAALSGPFEPKRALQQPEVRSDDGSVLAMAATRLADVCDTSPAGASGRWLMRTPARHTFLQSLPRDALEKAARARVAGDADIESVELVAVLLDQPPLSRSHIEALVEGAGDRADLERAILALDRAGDAAPAHDLLPSARSALGELHRQATRQQVSERGFVGRENECSEIADWLSQPSSSNAVRCLLVIAEPGMGKSTLLDEAMGRYCEIDRPLIIRLDFDRAGLDVLDQVGLTMEAARQLAEQMGRAGTELLDARQKAGRAQRDSDGRSSRGDRTRVPENLASLMGTAVAAIGRPVLVVLDTLEVLRGRGETHPVRLFQWLDALLAKGVMPMRVLGASRGDALQGLPEVSETSARRVPTLVPKYRVLPLPRLEDAAAEALLRKLSVPTALFEELLKIAQGNPLKLRLAAEIAKRTGIDKLPPRRRGAAVDAAFLYRFLLSRVEDPELRKLAHPGLIVRRINAALIREVLAPKLRLGSISEARAQALLDELAAHHWLVEVDPGTGFLKHRSDMRRLLLPLLYRSEPAKAARIDAAVIPWFASIREPWAQNEAIYHQLQLTRRGAPPPSVPSDVAAQFDDDMLDELPQAAADLVRSARGQRTSRLRGAQSGVGIQDDPGLMAEVLSVVERKDWFEGAHMVRQIVEAGTLDLRSQTADAVRTFLWRSGQWTEARRWLVERDRFHASDDDLPELPPPLALARLEMRAEFHPDRLRQRWRTQQDDMDRLASAALSTGDNLARHGPLAFLLAERLEPFRFPLISKGETDMVAAAFECWVEGGAAVKFGEVAREARARVEPKMKSGWNAYRVNHGRVLAMFTPYEKPLGNVAVLEGRGWLRESANAAAKVLASAGALLPGEPVVEPPQSGAISWLVDMGLFAEWLEALAFVRRDRDLQLIGRSAARWRRTLAGDWTFGRRRDVWRELPLLDETLRERVRDLQVFSSAQAHLSSWAEAIGADPDSFERRLTKASATAALLSGKGVSAERIAKELLTRGTPAAFVASVVAKAVAPMPRAARRFQLDPPEPIFVPGGFVVSNPPISGFQERTVNQQDKWEAFKARLTSGVEGAVREAIASGRLPPSAMAAISSRGLEAISTGEALESMAANGMTSIDGLEAIVKLVGRPPLIVRNDQVELEPMPLLPAETPTLIKGVERWVPSVGRIEFRNHDMAWGGTGWVAEKRGNGALVVTNRHVAKLVARRKADGTAVFMRSAAGVRYGTAIDFREESTSEQGDNSLTAQLTRVEYLADDAAADVALLFISAADFALPTPLRLADKDDLNKDDLVALIGYPAYDPRNDANAQARYFRDLYEVKRFAPGKILQRADGGIITYDCTSLGGNSGSPLIRLADGAVAGLHFSGIYGERNTAVSAGTLRALINGERPVSVNLHLEAQQEAADGSHAAGHFAGREGFNVQFLRSTAASPALRTPWPGIRADLAEGLAVPSDHPPEPNELRYTHFGVKYSGTKKIPLITAVNIDGKASVRIKRGTDKWFADERLPRDVQLNATHFKDPEIDRGHMVRREDPNWGDAAQLANDDTFHYVNAAAQHSRLNQGMALWQGLENYILDSARTHDFKACVFTGPVLRDDDDDIEEIVLDGAIAPAEFWKVVVTLDADDKALHATAYLLSQGQLIRKLIDDRSRREGFEGVVLGAYRTFQIAIADLAEATGYDFSAYVNADPLRKTNAGQEAAATGEPVFLPLDGVDDIIL